jgi:DNA primase
LKFYPQKVYTYFSDNFVLSKFSPQGWLSFDCTFCGKYKKMAVHLEIQYVKCWSCGAACNVAEFVQEVEGCNYYEACQTINSCRMSAIDLEVLSEIAAEGKVNEDITLPDGWQSITEGAGMLGKRARAYLESRGFDIDVLDFKGFGYCNKHHEDINKDFYGYIIVPFRSNGSLQYYLGRDFMNNFLRYKNPPADWVGVGKADVIYNEEALYMHKTIFVVEGWSDAEMLGKRGTATLGWNMSRTQLNKYYKSKASKLVFIPDAGIDMATGQTYYQKAVQTAVGFIETDKKVYVVDLNSVSDKGKDVCEIGLDMVIDLYKHHTPQLDWNLAMSILTN